MKLSMIKGLIQPSNPMLRLSWHQGHCVWLCVELFLAPSLLFCHSLQLGTPRHSLPDASSIQWVYWTEGHTQNPPVAFYTQKALAGHHSPSETGLKTILVFIFVIRRSCRDIIGHRLLIEVVLENILLLLMDQLAQILGSLHTTHGESWWLKEISG